MIYQGRRKAAGFTLVELAIVMTIIGLLIGGILKGQELLENARMTATMAQIKSYDAAINTFYDQYSYLPGDMPNAASRLPNCNSNCSPATAQFQGDGGIGRPYSFCYSLPISVAPAQPPGMDIGAAEPVLFWLHMLEDNLISGVTDEILNNPMPAAYGTLYPKSKVGKGGFMARSCFANAGGGAMPALPGSPVAALPATLYLYLAPPMPPSGLALTLLTAADQNPLTPGRAAQLDRKMDDGLPTTGSVVAYGVSASCFLSSGGTYIYDETVTTKDCGLLFKLRN